MLFVKLLINFFVPIIHNGLIQMFRIFVFGLRTGCGEMGQRLGPDAWLKMLGTNYGDILSDPKTNGLEWTQRIRLYFELVLQKPQPKHRPKFTS